MANGDLLEAERLALERFESDEELQFTIAAPLIRAAIDIFMRAMRRGEDPPDLESILLDDLRKRKRLASGH